MTILVPLAVPFPLSSRHLPGIPDTIGPAGSSHFWFAPPWQDKIFSCLPFVVLLPGSVRHRWDRGLTSCPPVWSCHRCAVLPLQVYRSTRVPMVALRTRRHLPWIRIVSSFTAVHLCEAEPLQVQMATLVPLAVLLPLSSRHLPPRFRRTGPVGPLFGAAVTVQVNDADPAPPEPSAAVTTGWYVPDLSGQPLTSPLLLTEIPGGSPAPVNAGAWPDESLAMNCRPTVLPATVPLSGAAWLSPVSSRVIMAGLTWSRSV